MENFIDMILEKGFSLNTTLIKPGNKDFVKPLKTLATHTLQSVQMNDIIEIFSQPAINPCLLSTIQAICILIYHTHPGPDWPQLRKQCKNPIQFLQDLWRINDMPEDLPEHLIQEIQTILQNNLAIRKTFLSTSRVTTGLYNWLVIYLKIMTHELSILKIEKTSMQRSKAKAIFLQLYMKTNKTIRF